MSPEQHQSQQAWTKARRRFYQMSAGNNAQFFDAKDRRVVTAVNVADWLYRNGAKKMSGEGFANAAYVSSHHWQSITADSVFAIGAPAIVKNGCHYSRNEWQDLGVPIDDGVERTQSEIIDEAKTFTDLLRLALCDRENAYCDDDGRVAFFVNWLRYVIQNPGSKPPTIPYTYGGQGHFKGTVLGALTTAFGRDTVASTAEDKALVDMNAHELFQASLLAVEEVRPDVHSGSKVYNAIKALSTASVTKAAGKHAGFGDKETPAALWLSSNHPPHFLEAGDRRFYVVRWEVGELDELQAELPSEDLDWVNDWKHMVWSEFNEWLEDDDGYAKLRRFIELVPTTFAPKDAPMTPEKRQALALNTQSSVLDIANAVDDSRAIIFKRDAFEAVAPNQNQVKHLAVAAGLQVLTLADCGSDAAKPRVRLSNRDIIRGKEYFYMRAGWALKQIKGKWSLIDPQGLTVELMVSHVHTKPAGDF